jgi:hypothetical protein
MHTLGFLTGSKRKKNNQAMHATSACIAALAKEMIMDDDITAEPGDEIPYKPSL